MNNPQLTQEQRETIDLVEFDLSNVKDQELLYNSLKKLVSSIPNNYDLGSVVREMFPIN